MRYRVEFQACLTAREHVAIVDAASPGEAAQQMLSEHEAIFLRSVTEMSPLSLGHRPQPWRASQEAIVGQMAAIREAIENRI